MTTCCFFSRNAGVGEPSRARVTPGLHGRKPVFRTIRHLVMSYVDPYVDGSGRIMGYGVADLRTLVKCDWRLSAKNVKEVERALIKMPHKPIQTSERRYQAILRQFQAFRKQVPHRTRHVLFQPQRLAVRIQKSNFSEN